MRNTCVFKRHFCGSFGISGIYVSEVVGTNLCPYPLSVRILINSAVRRDVSFDGVAESYSFSRAVCGFRLSLGPQLQNICRSEISSVFVYQNRSKDCIVCVVVGWGAGNFIGETASLEIKFEIPVHLFRHVACKYIAVHGIVSGFLKQAL